MVGEGQQGNVFQFGLNTESPAVGSKEPMFTFGFHGNTAASSSHTNSGGSTHREEECGSAREDRQQKHKAGYRVGNKVGGHNAMENHRAFRSAASGPIGAAKDPPRPSRAMPAGCGGKPSGSSASTSMPSRNNLPHGAPTSSDPFVPPGRPFPSASGSHDEVPQPPPPPFVFGLNQSDSGPPQTSAAPIFHFGDSSSGGASGFDTNDKECPAAWSEAGTSSTAEPDTSSECFVPWSQQSGLSGRSSSSGTSSIFGTSASSSSSSRKPRQQPRKKPWGRILAEAGVAPSAAAESPAAAAAANAAAAAAVAAASSAGQPPSDGLHAPHASCSEQDWRSIDNPSSTGSAATCSQGGLATATPSLLEEAKQLGEKQDYAAAMRHSLQMMSGHDDVMSLFKACIDEWEAMERQSRKEHEVEKNRITSQLMGQKDLADALRVDAKDRDQQLREEKRKRKEAEDERKKLQDRLSYHFQILAEMKDLRLQLQQAQKDNQYLRNRHRAPNRAETIKQIVKMEAEPLIKCMGEDRKKMKQKLLLKWHPDKQPSAEHGSLATEVIQELQNSAEWT